MHYSVLTLVTLFAAAMASPTGKRQTAAPPTSGLAGSPNAQTAAMTNKNGEIVPFDAANVYLDSVAKGF